MKKITTNKIKRLVKRAILPTLVAGTIAASALGRVDVEAPRFLGLYNDPYKNMSTEEVVKEVDSFDKARDYMIRHLTYKDVHTGNAPFERIHTSGKGICGDGALAAIALLSDDTDRYECKAMELDSRLKKLAKGPLRYGLDSHRVSLVKDKETGKYGVLGINAAECISPRYETPREAYNAVNKIFLGMFQDYELGKPNLETVVKGKNRIQESLKKSLEDPENKGKTHRAYFENPKTGKYHFFDNKYPDDLIGQDYETVCKALEKYPSFTEEQIDSMSKKDVVTCYFGSKSFLINATDNYKWEKK